jgi:hypothetical protein
VNNLRGTRAELEAQLRVDYPLYAKTCLKIIDKKRRKIPLELNHSQTCVQEAIDGCVKRRKPPRIIELKARQTGLCVSPDTLVLTADFRWVAISEVAPGDELISVDENPPGGKGAARKMRKATVEARFHLKSPALRIVTDRGEIVVTPEHKLLNFYGNSYLKWQEAKRLKVGGLLRMLVDPWPDSRGYGDGWFGGMLDGEGHLRRRKYGAEISIAQLPGPVMDRAVEYVRSRGFTTQLGLNGSGRGFGRTIAKLTCSRSAEIMQILGVCRPTRMLAKPWWEGMEPPNSGFATILAIEPVSKQEMVDLQTSTHTYIANGIISHNSTDAEGRLFHYAHLHANSTSVVMAHRDKSAQSIFNMSRNFYAWLPDWLRPDRRYHTKGSIEFKNNGSRMQVEVAKEGGGRGITAGRVHLSEFAWMAKPEEVLDAVLQAVPDTMESVVIVESTPFGLNEFYDLWVQAKSGQSDFVPVFLPWFGEPTYRMHADFTPESLDSDEVDLVSKYNLSLEQLAWRRWAIRNKLHGSKDKFKQEYPSDDVSCFLASGRRIFEVEALEYYNSLVPPAVSAESLPPPQEIELTGSPGNYAYELKVGWERSPLRIYQMPVEHHLYINGNDPSEGDVGSDHSPSVVTDRMTLEPVAVWNGRARPDLHARIATALCLLYNKAQMIWEHNNHGLAFQIAVEDLYDFFYMRESSPGSVAKRRADKPGYNTNVATRHFLFDTLRQAIDGRIPIIRDPAIVSQLGRLYYDLKNNVVAEEGRIGAERDHCDAAVAYALTLEAHRGDNDVLSPLTHEEVNLVLQEHRRARVAMSMGRNVDISKTLARFTLTANEVEKLDEEEYTRERRRERSGLARQN